MKPHAGNFEKIIDHFDLYVFAKDLNGCYTFVNQKVCDLFGKPMEAIIGQDDSQFFSLDISNDLGVNDQLVMQEDREIIDEEKIIISATGEIRFYRTEKKPVKDSKGNIIGLFGFSLDITERKLLKEELRESKGRFKAIFHQAPLGIAVVDSLTGQIYEANAAFERIAGRSVQELKKLDWMEITHPDDIQKDLDSMAEMNAGKTSGFSMEKRYIEPSGTVNWINMTIAPLDVKDKTKPRHLCMIEDINARKKAEQKLTLMAHYDGLTQLPNRTLFADRFKQVVATNRRNKTLIAMCFLDLDNFKPVNDSYGHDVGDKILIEVANRVKAIIREGDTASRLGGDEFALLLGGIDSLAHCEQFLERILDAINKPVVIQEITHQVSVSIGAQVYPADNADFDTLLLQADQAMYQAKLQGKNKYVVFDLTINL